MQAPSGIPGRWDPDAKNTPKECVSQVMQSHRDNTFSDKTKHITDPQEEGPQKMALAQDCCFGLTGRWVIPEFRSPRHPVPLMVQCLMSLDTGGLSSAGLVSRKPWEVEFDSKGESPPLTCMHKRAGADNHCARTEERCVGLGSVLVIWKVGHRGHTSQESTSSPARAAQCCPPTRSISITWELAKNAESLVLNQNLPFNKILSDKNLRSILEFKEHPSS